jgi:hypothetical protein
MAMLDSSGCEYCDDLYQLTYVRLSRMQGQMIGVVPRLGEKKQKFMFGMKLS